MNALRKIAPSIILVVLWGEQMAARRPVRAGDVDKIIDDTHAKIGRIYLLWLLGIVMGAFRLQPTGVSMAGFSFTMQNAAILEGVIFLGCLSYYLAMCMPGIRVASMPPYSTLRMRAAIYSCIYFRDRSLTKRTSQQITTIKVMARGFRCYVRFMTITYFCLPLGHILLFRHQAVWAAIQIKVVFS